MYFLCYLLVALSGIYHIFGAELFTITHSPIDIHVTDIAHDSIVPYMKHIADHSNVPPFKPRVSIITSLYKGDQFIEGFMEDITQQTIFNECELIIINAHSPGNESAVIQRYLEKYSNITYLKLAEDPGIYGVWNLAIRLAQGEYITNANLDDRKAPFCIETHVKLLDAHQDIDLVYAPYLVTYMPNQTFAANTPAYLVDLPEFAPENIVHCLPGNAPVWRKTMHEKYGYFNPWFFAAGDWEMWLRAVSRGAKFKKINQISSLCYENREGLSFNPQTAHARKIEIAVAVEAYNYLWRK